MKTILLFMLFGLLLAAVVFGVLVEYKFLMGPEVRNEKNRKSSSPD